MALGSGELLIVLVIALLVFGPKKLPELARSLGQAVAEFNKAQREFEREIEKAKSGVDREISAVTSLEPAPKAAPKAPQAASQQQPASVPTYSSQKISEIAKNLGIKTEGKTDAQLLKEISEKTKPAEVKKEVAN